MSFQINNPQNIAIIDLWTDANRGDNALQVGLVKMLRDTYPNASLTGIFRFGYNEIDMAQNEITDTVAHLDTHYGGLRRTSYAGARANRNKLYRKLHSLWSFIELFLFIALYKARLRFMVPERLKSVMQSLEQADLVVWKGKNFRQYNGFGGIQRQLTLTIAGIIADLFSERVICVNASFWPINDKIQSAIIRRSFKNCRKVTVRDNSSITNYAALTHQKPDYCLDLSFYDVYDRLQKNPVRRDGEYDLALTITAWGTEAQKQSYVDFLAKALAPVIDKNPNAKIAIVPQVVRKAEDSSAQIEQLIEKIGAQYFEILEDIDTIDDLLASYAKAGLLIGTRMHSCVFAASVGTPFLAIAYDEGPKWEILHDLAPSQCVVNYSQLHQHNPATFINHAQLKDFDLATLAKRAGDNVAL